MDSELPSVPPLLVCKGGDPSATVQGGFAEDIVMVAQSSRVYLDNNDNKRSIIYQSVCISCVEFGYLKKSLQLELLRQRKKSIISMLKSYNHFLQFFFFLSYFCGMRVCLSVFHTSAPWHTIPPNHLTSSPPVSLNTDTILFFKLYLFVFMCVSVLLACLSVHLMRAWCPWRSEGSFGSLELALQIALNYQMLAGNQSPLPRENQCSYLLSHPPGPASMILIWENKNKNHSKTVY